MANELLEPVQNPGSQEHHTVLEGQVSDLSKCEGLCSIRTEPFSAGVSIAVDKGDTTFFCWLVADVWVSTLLSCGFTSHSHRTKPA